jgi:hypothetical protein
MTGFILRTQRVRLTWRIASSPDFVAWDPGRGDAGTLNVDPAPNVTVMREPPDARPILFEYLDYDVDVESLAEGTVVELRHRDPALLRRSRRLNGGRATACTLNFRGDVGTSQFEVLCNGLPELAFSVEVYPSKLDFRTDLAAMTRDLEAIAPSMILAWLRSTGRAADGNPDQPSEVGWTTALRDHLSGLERALRHVATRPHRAVTRTEAWVPAQRLRHPDAATRRAVRRGQGRGPPTARIDDTDVRCHLPRRTPEATLDTPEHRWLAARLDRVRRRLLGLLTAERTLGGKEPEEDGRRATTMRELADALERVTRLSLLEPIAAADGPPPPGMSPLRLLRAEGYAEAVKALRDVDEGLALGEGLGSLSTLGLAELYELWVWTAVVRAAAATLGATFDPGRVLPLVQRGLHLRLDRKRLCSVPLRGTRGREAVLSYNPTYVTGVLGRQQPDVVIDIRSPGWPDQRLLLDAKYRVDASLDHQKAMGAPAPPIDAINALHRYRDAIREATDDPERPTRLRLMHTVVEAAAAYPYAPSDTFERAPVWTSLAECGTGAIPLLPGPEGSRYLRAWFERVFNAGPWDLADRATRHRSVTQTAHNRSRANQRVLVGLVPDQELSRLDWILSTRSYYVPLERGQDPDLLDLEHLALLFRQPGTPFGTVRHHAPVLRCRIVPREEIPTPWPPRHAAARHCVLFTLGQPETLEDPIENVDADGQPLFVPRGLWTTQLALHQARTLMELGLETEHHWRVRDALHAAGVPHRLRFEAPDARLPRTSWFEGSDWTVRIQSQAVVFERSASISVETISSLLEKLTAPAHTPPTSTAGGPDANRS